MTFVLLAATAALASFAIVDAAASAAVALAYRLAGARLDRYSPSSRAAVLFRLRVLPALMAVIFGFGISLPVFVAFEPVDTDEPVSRTLVVIASAGLAALLRAAWHAWSAWRDTVRVSREWQRRGRRLGAREIGETTALPAFAIEAAFPTVAVVGMARPVLFVAERVLAECSMDEIRAMIAHESAHISSRDNVKRFLLRSSPDLLGRCSALTRGWSAAAEEAADAAAVWTRPGCALDLAQALIRVARLAPASVPELASSFYPGGDIERRIRRLIDPVQAPDAPAVLGGWLFWSAGIAVVAATLVFAPALHQTMEALVRIVP